MKHIIICGTGRSGTNRMLDVFDFHESTLCRNEVHALDTHVGRLPRAEWDADLPHAFSSDWEDAIRSSASTQSARDRLRFADKNYLNKFAQLTGPLVRRRNVRRIVVGRRQEWPIPSVWLKKKEAILPVIKILSRGRWIAETHAAFPDQFVVHVLRNPKSVLQSWMNRFVMKESHSPEVVFEQVKKRAKPIVEKFGGESVPDAFSIENLLYGQLWLWRNEHDSLAAALNGSPRYGIFDYDDYSSDPVSEAKRAFEFVGLPFEDHHATRINAMTNTLFSKPHSSKVPDEIVRAQMIRVLKDSAVGQRYLS